MKERQIYTLKAAPISQRFKHVLMRFWPAKRQVKGYICVQ